LKQTFAPQQTTFKVSSNVARYESIGALGNNYQAADFTKVMNFDVQNGHHPFQYKNPFSGLQ
jgi:hypothetical protein